MKYVLVLFGCLLLSACSDTPSSPARFGVGDLVKLKSGGPTMTIYRKFPSPTYNWVYQLTYADSLGVVHDDTEPEEILDSVTR